MVTTTTLLSTLALGTLSTPTNALSTDNSGHATIAPVFHWSYPSVWNGPDFQGEERAFNLYASLIKANDTQTILAVNCQNTTTTATAAPKQNRRRDDDDSDSKTAAEPHRCPWNHQSGTTTLTIQNNIPAATATVTAPAGVQTVTFQAEGTFTNGELVAASQVSMECTLTPSVSPNNFVTGNCAESATVRYSKLKLDESNVPTATSVVGGMGGGSFGVWHIELVESDAAVPITITAGLENVETASAATSASSGAAASTSTSSGGAMPMMTGVPAAGHMAVAALIAGGVGAGILY